MGPGNWGICGNKSLVENGGWTSNGIPYKNGEIISLSGYNGVISYSINYEDNSKYLYDMKTSNLYIAASLNLGDELEFVC